MIYWNTVIASVLITSFIWLVIILIYTRKIGDIIDKYLNGEVVNNGSY
jgi:hypothetical protein